MDWLALAGRLLMSAIFIHGGVVKALAPTATMGYFGKLGLPMPGAAYALTLLVEIGVGILFLVWLPCAVDGVGPGHLVHRHRNGRALPSR